MLRVTFGILFALTAITACGGDDDSGGPTTTLNAAPGTGAQATSDSTPSPTAVVFDLGDAESAVLRQFDYVDKGQWGKEWEELHPAQQAIVTKSAFVACNSEVNPDLDVEVLESYEESIAMPEIGIADTVAVTVRIKGNVGVFGLPSETTDTFHEILVDGEWRWVLQQQSTLDAYAAGICPS